MATAVRRYRCPPGGGERRQPGGRNQRSVYSGKVTRDAEMATLDLAFPHYGFAQHKGYPTAVHLQKLQEHGATEHHRRSFGPVKRAGPASN